MKRPLALFGLAFLLSMLAAVRLPAALSFAAGGLGAGVFLVCVVLRRRGRMAPARLQAAGLAAAALVAAVLVRAGYHALLVRPVEALAGRELTVTARVLETEPGYSEDTVHARLKVLELEGAGDDGPQGGFKIQLRGMPAAEPGALVRLDLGFYPFTTSQSRISAYGKGCYIGARMAAGAEMEQLGAGHTPLTRLRRLQYAAGDNIREKLPLRLGSIAAAMAVGDRRSLTYEAKEAYRAAGISHLMVVSGLHLSLVCGLWQGLTRRAARKRPKLFALAGLGFVLLFMLFTGLTPSVVRSGLVWMLVLLAPALGRRADVLTSLGLAALVLALQNPYAAADVGLLLSFTATLGALAGGQLAETLRHRGDQRLKARAEAGRDGAGAARKPGFARRLLNKLGWGLAGSGLVSLAVSAATLPVLVYAGMGLALPSLPMNIIAVPLLGPLVVLGLVMAIPAGLPVLGLLTVPAALLEGLMLRALELLTQLCQGLPWGWVPLGGAFGLVVVLAVYALALGALRLRRQRGRAAAFGLAALLMLPLAAGLHAALNTGTVKLTVAGSGAQSSLVVTSGGQSVVLYRGSAGLPAAERILKQERAGDCLLFVDLRKTAESAGYRDRLEPRRVLLVQEELMGRLVEQPLPGVELYLAKQGGGTIACVEVAGYKVGIGSGRLDLSGYAPLDVLVAGSSAVTGSYETLLAGATAPEWAAPAGETIHNDGEAQIWIRPGKSVRIREVNHGDG